MNPKWKYKIVVENFRLEKITLVSDYWEFNPESKLRVECYKNRILYLDLRKVKPNEINPRVPKM